MDAKTVLLIYDNQAKLCKLAVFLEQCMGADDDIGLALSGRILNFASLCCG